MTDGAVRMIATGLTDVLVEQVGDSVERWEERFERSLEGRRPR
jgi:hypothetical protein